MIQPQRIIECKKVIQILDLYAKKIRAKLQLEMHKKGHMDFNTKPTSAAKTQRFVTNDAWPQALTKHRNVLLEVNFSVEVGGFFWGKKGTVVFWVGRNSKDSL